MGQVPDRPLHWIGVIASKPEDHYNEHGTDHSN